jgi:hypothetical protein
MLKVTAIYSILMGILLIGTWLVLFALGQVPELWTQPLDTGFLLLAEFLTGIGLIVGGYGVLAVRQWGFILVLFALGMMFYTVVRSIGLFAEQGVAFAAGWFILVTLLMVLLMGYLLRHPSQQHNLV